MNPPADTEDYESDERYRQLLQALHGSVVAEQEVFALHVWLSTQADERGISEAIRRNLDSQKHKEQVEVCSQLESFATEIASRFDFLSQLSVLDFEFSQAFRSLENLHGIDQNQSWTAFRERLRVDATFLGEIAKLTKADLEKRGAKKGRPPKAWRDENFVELFRRISALLAGTQDTRAYATILIWNKYFPKARVMEVEAAVKSLFRTRKRKGLKDIKRK